VKKKSVKCWTCGGANTGSSGYCSARCYVIGEAQIEDLVRRLVAAEKVIEAARKHPCDRRKYQPNGAEVGELEIQCTDCAALAAYDKAKGVRE
jgi:hypothetical protein